jgi:hypothetical protein
MPKKISKKKSAKKNVSNKNTLEFNVNLENNPNGLVDPIVKAVNDEGKLAKLLNGMTQNSFNDGVDATIHNTAMLLNTQLNEALGSNPGMFNKKTLEKMLHYVIEPTFNQLNEMANNTNYNYNQFGGVVSQKQFNNNLKKGEQKGGFYTMTRVRSPMFMPRLVSRGMIPRVSFNPKLLIPRTMVVPSYAIITHDRVRDLMDRRERDKFNTYLSHKHSFETNDSKEINIRDHPDAPNHKKITSIERLGYGFYKVDVENGPSDLIVNGFNLYYVDNRYRGDLYYGVFRQLLNRIEVRALHKSKNNAEKLRYIDEEKVTGLPRNADRKCSNQDCKNILEVKNGYFKDGGLSVHNRHVMMLENIID